jgi:hypothetical protein
MQWMLKANQFTKALTNPNLFPLLTAALQEALAKD